MDKDQKKTITLFISFLCDECFFFTSCCLASMLVQFLRTKSCDYSILSFFARYQTASMPTFVILSVSIKENGSYSHLYFQETFLGDCVIITGYSANAVNSLPLSVSCTNFLTNCLNKLLEKAFAFFEGSFRSVCLIIISG